MIKRVNESSSYYRMPFDDVQWAVDIANQYVGSKKSLDDFIDYMMLHIRDDADDEGYRDKLDNYEDDVIEVLKDMWYDSHPKEDNSYYGDVITPGILDTGEDIEFEIHFYDPKFIVKNGDLIDFDKVSSDIDTEIENSIKSIARKYKIDLNEGFTVETWFSKPTERRFEIIRNNDMRKKDNKYR